MSAVDKRSISLTPELAAIVDSAVAEGEYASISEVVRDALREWKERRDLHGYTREEVRALLQAGLSSGEPVPWDKASFLATARQRINTEQKDR